jgi:hypothetical protein
MTDWLEDEPAGSTAERRWPLAPTHLLPRERWVWWEQQWSDVLMLRRALPDLARKGLVGGRRAG